MSHQVLSELVAIRGSEASIRTSGTNEASTVESDTPPHYWLRSFLLNWRQGFEERPAAALLTVVLLLAYDLMAFLLFSRILWSTSKVACAVWVFLPPLTQPAAILLGPIFLLSEDPRLGRLFASLEVFGAINAMLAFLVLILLLLVDSLLFDFIALGLSVVSKCLLFAAASAHVVNLEAAKDQSVMETSQAEFVSGILSNAAAEHDEDDADDHVSLQFYNMNDADRDAHTEVREEGISPPRSRSGSSLSVARSVDNQSRRASRGPPSSPQGGLLRKEAPSLPSPF